MNAKKALKKLKKKVIKKVENRSIKELKNKKLERSYQSNNKDSISPYAIANDLKNVVNQAAISAVHELAVPLNPLRSWFNDTDTIIDLTAVAKRAKSSRPKPSANDAASMFAVKSVGYLPLKSPPCKRCPALSNGICKCAAKKFKLSA